MQALTIVTSIKQSFSEIHNEAMAAAQDIKHRYLILFEVLLKVEAHQIYQQFEVTSLYLYCTELLELSPSIAHDFITVVRKSLEIPELADAVRSKRITISKARKICPVITTSDFKQWIELAEACSTRIVEKAVAQARPRSAVQESMTYVSEDTLEFKLAVSEEWQQLLLKTKDQLSQKCRKVISSEEAILILMKENFAKNDPVEKSKRALSKKGFSKSTRAATATGDSEVEQNQAERDEALEPVSKLQVNCLSRYRPAQVEHIVNLRDQNQCAYVDSRGTRCDEKRWLHKHHIQEFANGGAHAPENLETLCRGHHKIKHMKKYEPAGCASAKLVT